MESTKGGNAKAKQTHSVQISNMIFWKWAEYLPARNHHKFEMQPILKIGSLEHVDWYIVEKSTMAD